MEPSNGGSAAPTASPYFSTTQTLGKLSVDGSLFEIERDVRAIHTDGSLSGMPQTAVVFGPTRFLVDGVEVNGDLFSRTYRSRMETLVAAARGAAKPEPPLDCRSDEGVTVGLIDSLIAVCRVLAHRELGGAHVSEALADLWQDEDVAVVMGAPR